MTEITLRRIAMVGFGEAGSILGAELAAAGLDVATYDILLDKPASRGPMLEKARGAHVVLRSSRLMADRRERWSSLKKVVAEARQK